MKYKKRPRTWWEKLVDEENMDFLISEKTSEDIALFLESIKSPMTISKVTTKYWQEESSFKFLAQFYADKYGTVSVCTGKFTSRNDQMMQLEMSFSHGLGGCPFLFIIIMMPFVLVEISQDYGLGCGAIGLFIALLGPIVMYQFARTNKRYLKKAVFQALDVIEPGFIRSQDWSTRGEQPL